MDDLKRFAVFAEVVRCGSLSAAARFLGISPSAVSQHLRALEAEHRVTLLNRTTRKLTLTPTGARIAEHCRAMRDATARAREQLARARDIPDGELRIAAPVGFARFLGPALAPLLAEYPALSLTLLVADEPIDLIDERIDLAIRARALPDSGWVAQPLFRLELRICAAPAYLATAGIPATPQALPAHQWIGFNAAGDTAPLALRDGAGRIERVEIRHRFGGNSIVTHRELCAAGLGLALLVTAEARDQLNGGRLVPLLDGWRIEPLPLWAVTPARHRPARVRRAIAALRDSMLRSNDALPW